MANVSNKILLVEGIDDQCFFKGFINRYCDNLKEVDVQVLTPKDVNPDEGYNSKQGALMQIVNLTKGQAAKMHLGLIVDADQTAHGAGFSQFLSQINAKLKPNGFVEPELKQEGIDEGVLFSHPLHSCGVWVMPNNLVDGSFEDWLLEVVEDNANQCLLPLAKDVVNRLNSKNFREHDENKAVIGTWLSWQSSPRGGASNFFKRDSNLINRNHPKVKALVSWLNELFSE